jgi:hypothetical protein
MAETKRPHGKTTTKIEIGVLRFDREGKQERQVNNNTDPTNFNQRCAEALATHADFLKKHPDGWATTPRRGISDMTKIRHREITIGRSLSEVERDELLASK